MGEGGCGVVYGAQQNEPVRRRVALKVIKLWMDTKEVIARFEAERQALAMMDHSNIAKVLGAGATEAGRPYFVMELVRGIRFTDYCDQSQLSTKERLDLFIKICQAIQHAHQEGIIHRDIKPSNILVTLHDGVPVPKVIRGDLDWIVMKCLEKDRTRRYETANGSTFDILRPINNEPVLARPPSQMHRFQKLVRRNKVIFCAATTSLWR